MSLSPRSLAQGAAGPFSTEWSERSCVSCPLTPLGVCLAAVWGGVVGKISFTVPFTGIFQRGTFAMHPSLSPTGVLVMFALDTVVSFSAIATKHLDVHATAGRHACYDSSRTSPATKRPGVVRMRDIETPCQDESSIRADAEAAFRLLDLDGDGEISSSELKSYLLQFRYTESASQKIYEALDVDNCGTIHLDDLRDGLSEYCRCSKCEVQFVERVHEEADALFDVVDVDGDGEIDPDELRSHLVSHLVGSCE